MGDAVLHDSVLTQRVNHSGIGAGLGENIAVIDAELGTMLIDKIVSVRD
ncbi:MAG: hypothetical protein R3B54_03640 [Bdellovibrionota bacterium]